MMWRSYPLKAKKFSLKSTLLDIIILECETCMISGKRRKMHCWSRVDEFSFKIRLRRKLIIVVTHLSPGFEIMFGFNVGERKANVLGKHDSAILCQLLTY